MMSIGRGMMLAGALLAASGAMAQTVYKTVDEKGNVSYSADPPAKGREQKTQQLTIDPNQNVMPAQTPAPRSAPSASSDEAARAKAQRIAEARAALEAAEAQLQAGTETQAGDFLGRAGGGVRPAPQRMQRTAELQRAVDEAREYLERVQSE